MQLPIWTIERARTLWDLSFFDLLYRAQNVHRQHFNPLEIQISALLSIKTGGCPEDCAYCPQAGQHKIMDYQPLMDIQEVLAAAKKAKSSGASRFCMGAAWRAPTDRQINHVCDMIKGIKALSLEACVTLGLLKEGQAEKLKEAGLDYYNHNLDTSAEYYKKIITTRSFQDRLDTLQKVSDAGIGVCCGGIIGMGESTEDRLSFLCSLANLNPVPGSVTINQLIKVPGTPLQDAPLVDPFDFVRVIAMSRIMIPESWVRLSAGRQQMSDELQALCFLAGANSLFYGDKLLTEDNAKPIDDDALLHRLGLMKKQQAFD